jgi:hypothetical protein
MAYERDGRPGRRLPGEPQASRSRGVAFGGPEARQVQPVPGRRTLVEALGPRPAAPVRAARSDAAASPEAEQASHRGADGLAGAAPLPFLQLGRKDAKQKAAAPKAEDARKGQGEAAAVGAWAGAGASGQIFQNDTIEAFVDSATGDTVEVRTDWMLAEFESFELSTNALLAVEREIHVRLARGVSLLARSRARAWIHADRLPNDVHAALHAPARLIKHDGSIFVTDDKGVHLLAALPHPLVQEQSVAGLLANAPLLGFETDGPRRIQEAERFAAVTVPQHEANREQIAAIQRDAPRAALGLTRYIKTKLAYESPDPEPLAIGRHMIARIEALTSGTWTGYEGAHVLFWLREIGAGFTKLVASAEKAKPAEKDVWDHAADAARAIGKAIVGVGVAVKEIALTARDLGLWLADELASVFGADIAWSAASSIGKAYESGRSTGEIFKAIVDGIVDAWDQAIERAANGDYSKLMDLGAELALDIAIGVATSGAAAPALAAERFGSGATRAGRALALAEQSAAALAQHTRATLAKVRRTVDAAPEHARRAALELQDALQGLLEGLTQAQRVADTGTGARMAVLDPGAIPRAIQRVRTERAMASAEAAVNKLGGAARKQGKSVLAKLRQRGHEPKMESAIHAMTRKITSGKDKERLVAALDRVLGAWPPRLDSEVLARVLRRAAGARDPVRYLDDAIWVLSHKGLTQAAREGLMRHVVRSSNPLDIHWLRELTELPDHMLEFMALDPATQWRDLMKVSTRPSDYFPSSVKKLLAREDYARAAGKLRGIAGELTVAVEGIELPGGLKIVARQVDAKGKKIDFGLQNARGEKAKLEVKAWSRKTWERELPKLTDPPKMPPKSMAGRMIEQLRAARAPGERVYLAVPDAIGELIGVLKASLRKHGLDKVDVVTFSESKLKSNFTRLKAGLALAPGVTLVMADQFAEVDDD